MCTGCRSPRAPAPTSRVYPCGYRKRHRAGRHTCWRFSAQNLNHSNGIGHAMHSIALSRARETGPTPLPPDLRLYRPWQSTWIGGVEARAGGARRGETKPRGSFQREGVAQIRSLAARGRRGVPRRAASQRTQLAKRAAPVQWRSALRGTYLPWQSWRTIRMSHVCGASTVPALRPLRPATAL